MSDRRMQVCEACGGDKGWAVPHDICRVTGALIERWEPCHYCGETGEQEVEVEPVTLADLDDIALSGGCSASAPTESPT